MTRPDEPVDVYTETLAGRATLTLDEYNALSKSQIRNLIRVQWNDVGPGADEREPAVTAA